LKRKKESGKKKKNEKKIKILVFFKICCEKETLFFYAFLFLHLRYNFSNFLTRVERSARGINESGNIRESF
jgi:hypothetical protein